MRNDRTFVIYFNPECSKCMAAKSALEEAGNACELVEYLETPPTEEELKSLLKKLGKKPIDIIRTGEEVFQKNYEGKILTDDEWINAIVKNPVLLQRPIVVQGDKAWVARSPEVLDKIK